MKFMNNQDFGLIIKKILIIGSIITKNANNQWGIFLGENEKSGYELFIGYTDEGDQGQYVNINTGEQGCLTWGEDGGGTIPHEGAAPRPSKKILVPPFWPKINLPHCVVD